MEVDFNTRVTAYQTARERLQQLKDGAVNRQALLKVTGWNPSVLLTAVGRPCFLAAFWGVFSRFSGALCRRTNCVLPVDGLRWVDRLDRTRGCVCRVWVIVQHMVGGYPLP